MDTIKDVDLIKLMIENMLCYVLYNLYKNGLVKVRLQKANFS